MYASLKKWMNVPVIINPYERMDSAGDKAYGPGKDLKCLVEGKVRVVVNSSGTEVVSSTTLYMDGALSVKEADTVTYKNVTRPIKALGEYYEQGIRDIWMVHI